MRIVGVILLVALLFQLSQMRVEDTSKVELINEICPTPETCCKQYKVVIEGDPYLVTVLPGEATRIVPITQAEY